MQTPAMGASEPMFNLPRVVVLLAGVMVAMQFIQILLPTEESLQFLLALAFIPARYSGAAAELPGGDYALPEDEDDALDGDEPVTDLTQA